MSVSKLRNSPAAGKANGISAVAMALRIGHDVEHIQEQKQTRDAEPGAAITSDSVRMYLRGISEHSGSELDSLISELTGLREKLMSDGTLIEQQIAEYTALNQSVLKLAEVVSAGVAQVKTS